MTLNELHDELDAERVKFRTAMNVALDAIAATRHLMSKDQRAQVEAFVMDGLTDVYMPEILSLKERIREHEMHEHARQLRSDIRDFKGRVL